MRQLIPKIKFVLLALIVFSLSCYIYITGLFIVLFAITWVLEGNFAQKLNAWRKNTYALLFTGFYILYALWLLRSPPSNWQSGDFNLQVKLSMGIFPFMLVSEGEFTSNKKQILMWAFISGCFINGLICFGHAIWKYYALGIFEFTYSQFSWFLHPSYYTMYLDLALLFIFYMVTSPEIGTKRKEKIALIFISFFLLLLIIMLQSKAGWMCTLLLIAILLVKLFMNKTSRKLSVMVFLGCIVIGASAYYGVIAHSYLRLNIFQTLWSTGKMDSTSGESTQARYYIWKAGKQLVAEQPLIGFGTGQAWGKLQQQYTKDKYTGPLIKQLNAHNQYLQCAIDLGIIGLLYMIICFILPFIKAIKEKRFIYGMFISIILINIIFESMFEQQSGTIFYGLFNSLLMFNFVI